MAQVTSGINALLSSPLIYVAWQSFLGAQRMHEQSCKHLRLQTGDSVLDIGCGPADVLAMLPDVNYLGVDLSPTYIENAKRRFGARGKFQVGSVYDLLALREQNFTAILAQGLLHHLSDNEAEALCAFAAKRLSTGGRLVTVDPARTEQQGFLARFLVDHDRGKDVRSPAGYETLARRAFRSVRCELSSDLLRLPYTLCYMICQN
jgi:SAM-dependent methyltransferase